MPSCRFEKDALLPDAVPVETAFLRQFLPGAPGDYVKVYLYGRLLCHTGEEGDPARALALSDETVLCALTYWQEKGIVRIECRAPLRVSFLDPRHPAPMGSSMLYTHRELFSGLQAVLKNRRLTERELRMAADWVEVFGLSEEAALYLAEYCVRIKGEGIAFSYMDAVAKGWADADVHTKAQAEEHVLEYEEQLSGAAEIKKLWRQGKSPTVPELELYEKWTRGWGFPKEGILLLARETTGTDKPTFRYLDAVVENYRAHGVKTTEAISKHLKAREGRESTVRERTRLLFERAGIRRSPTAEDKMQVEVWLFEQKIPMELLFFAAEKSASASKPFLYMKKLVSAWREAGINTLAAAQAETERHKEARERELPAAKKDSAWNYPQRRYSEEELLKNAVPLDGEDENG